jgi:hypothetical protein
MFFVVNLLRSPIPERRAAGSGHGFVSISISVSFLSISGSEITTIADPGTLA